MADQMGLQQIMQRLGGPEIFNRLREAIETVGLATDETGQPGKVTLTIKTSKPKGAEKGDRYVAFETRIVATAPSPAAKPTGLYVDESGLHSADPRQTRMELRAVEQGQGETRETSVGSPEMRRA